MAWADIFTPSGTQTEEEAAANLAREQALANQRLAQHQGTGDIIDQNSVRLGQEVNAATIDSEDAAAAQGFAEGAKQGLSNVLDFPGKVIGAVGSGSGQLLWGVLKNIPWWVYLGGLVALFVWMGGLSLLRGRLSK